MKQGSVVVGVDGSTGADAALVWAAAHAARRRLPLLVVHAVGAPHDRAQLFGGPETVEARREVAEAVSDGARALVQHLGLTLDVEVTNPAAEPRQALLGYADRASIVVVGTRGLGAVRVLLLGAVSAAVVAQAPCPVAVVRPAAGDDDGHDRHVVVGIDAGPASTSALEFAFELASTEGRPLDVLHSWGDRDVVLDRDRHEQRRLREDEHQRMVGEAVAGYAEKYPDVVVERHLAQSDAVETLLELSRTAAAVVVASPGRSAVHSLFGGSVSRELVEQAHCTVVVVRP